MGIDVQLLIYTYMAVCVNLLLFNSVYIFVDRSRTRRLNYPKKDIEFLRVLVLAAWENGDLSEQQHKNLRKRLASLNGLEKCYSATDILMKEIPAEMEKFFHICSGDFRYLADVYLKKGEIEKAYFSRFVERHRIGREDGYDSLKKVLVEMTTSYSVYTRENALKALCMMGNTEAVRHSVEAMNRLDITHYSKLLADTLLCFQGDQKELAASLWSNRRLLKDAYLLAVMQFIRMSQSGYEDEFLNIVKDDKQNIEIRLEAIRYFRKYRYPPAYQELLNIVKNEGNVDWEYVAVAVSSLGNYRRNETVSSLKRCLTSSNWYVRYNAAETLIGSFGLSHAELSDIYHGQDVYAKEILTYMEQRYHEEATEVRAG